MGEEKLGCSVRRSAATKSISKEEVNIAEHLYKLTFEVVGRMNK
jgi:hypothetical protein